MVVCYRLVVFGWCLCYVCLLWLVLVFAIADYTYSLLVSGGWRAFGFGIMLVYCGFVVGGSLCCVVLLIAWYFVFRVFVKAFCCGHWCGLLGGIVLSGLLVVAVCSFLRAALFVIW